MPYNSVPARGGFLTVELTNKIDIFLRKAVKWGYAQKTATRVTRNAMLIAFHSFHTDCTFRCHIADICNAECMSDDKYAYLYIPAPLNL